MPANSAVISALDTSGREVMVTVGDPTLVDALSMLR
jgi:hypothetical protein